MHILLIVRSAHGLTAAIDCHGACTLELTNQPHRVVFVIVQSDETDNALQYLGSKRINVAIPCFGQNTESLRINAFAMLPILTKGRSDASDFPFCMALIEAQAKSSTLGSTLKCDGFRVAAMNFGAQLCTCRKRCRDTRLLCKQQGFFLFGQARVHLADDVEIRIVVQQLAGSDGVLTIKDIVVTVTITDLGCVGNALIKFSSDALDAAGVEMPLVVATRNFQKLTVDDHFVMNEFNHRQILLPV